jgi:hypothetical protein
MRRKVIKNIIAPQTITTEVKPDVVIELSQFDKLIRKLKQEPHVNLNETTNFLDTGSKEVFIVAGGPSLAKTDLSFLEGRDVICINKAIDLVKNPTYFITMDYSFFSKVNKTPKEIAQLAQSSHFIINKQHSYIQKINGFYVDTRHGLQYSGLEHFSSVISSVKESNEITGFGQTFSEFSHGENSGYCAIQFAILAGYTEIYLLGFDMFETQKESQTHFHKDYPPRNINRFNASIKTYKKHILDSIAKIKKVKRLRIYTITPSSLEAVVPRVSSSKFFTQKPREIISNTDLSDLVIVAYYTLNTPYEQEAEKLINSLNKLGLTHDVVGVPNLGNWQANTRFKAKFMQAMLDKHIGKNLLYVDSDAIVHSKPVLFKDYEADIAVRWQDFRWRENECLSGTIFMANNKKTRELCQRWQGINESEGPNATTFEQWNLGSIIKQMESEGKITSKNLPPEYTMIFDSMRAMYPNVVPVIEHFQASRKLRNKV